jgi:hypothetical protein
MSQTITLEQASNLINICGTDNTFVIQGEPGIGKSAMLDCFDGERHTVYVDCALLDLGDLQMVCFTEKKDFVMFVPNKIFAPKGGMPVVIMLDEIGKANRMVQNALLTLLHEHRIGNYRLPKGSCVFGTTNLVSDGVGDMMQAHAKNRVSFMTVRKPNAEEWLRWAANHGVVAEILAWVNEYPHCLDSYTDATKGTDNPYIYDPRKQQDSFVTPRSLFNASNIIFNREQMSSETLVAALAGTIGESAAMDMKAFISVADALPSWGLITANPSTCPIPENPIACTICALGAVSRLTSKTLPAWMTYVRRLPREVQFMWAGHAMRNTAKAAMICQNADFTRWAGENAWAI